VCADAFKIPFSARTFDVVWNSGFLEHFTNPKKLLFQMRYVLRQEGLLVVLVPNRWTPHSLWIRDRLRAKLGGYKWDNMGRERSYTQRQLICLLWDAGFQVIASSTSNLRRSLLDDSWVLSHMTYLALRGFLFRLMNSIDCIENRFPSLRNFGFMVGAAATQLPKANKRVLLS
jgi:SAM-dependent methyltransferase